jgi:hypothetical protein
MKTTAKKKPHVAAPTPIRTTPAKKLGVPTLLERVDAICKEVEDAIDLQCEITKKAAPGVPTAMIKQMTLSRAGLGQCVCAAYRKLMKDGGV